MGKTWAAVALVLLAVGPAAVRADDLAVRRLRRQHDTFGSDYLPPPVAASPAVPGGATPAPPAESPAPATPAAPSAPVMVPAGGPCCDGCLPPEEPHQHFGCIRKLIGWLTYCPLKKGVNCERCGHDGHGDCCCYHCFPSPYLFVMQPCIDGHPPSMPCWGCSCSGGGPPQPVIRSPAAAGGTASQGTETPAMTMPTTPAAPAPAAEQTPPSQYGPRNGYFGTRRRVLSLSSGFGFSSVGSR